ncbi:MAG: hypothetical protein IPK00_08755 [Deltaproteobacteria bacterium]|nr:hypothetical protein [Deltaproteobacteria bacterium]
MLRSIGIRADSPRRPALRIGLALTGLVCTLLAVRPCSADEDTLGDFEDEIERREDEENEDDTEYRGSSSGSSTSEANEAIGTVIGGTIGAVLDGSAERATENLARPDQRRGGEPATAIVRLESSYQRLSHSDVDGLSTRAEILAGPLGVGGEFLRYWEDSPQQHLDFAAIEGLLRFAPNGYFQITLAVGSRHIDGRRSRWAHGGGVGLGFHPQTWLGFEADLRWAKVGDRALGDYRIGALLRVPKFPYLALRGGYRVIQYQNETLDGPELGLVGTW